MRDRLRSFEYAAKGIRCLLAETPNARIHLSMALAVVGSGFLFRISVTEWCLCILCIALVMMAEGFNSALEYLTDLVSPGLHELAGKTKDVAAGAVLLASLGAALVGLIIFLPKVWAFFF